MARSIRGHSTVLTLFQDGKEIVVDSITGFQVQQDSSMSRSFYVGQAVGEGDQTQDGWSGSMDIEVKNANIDDAIDSLVTEGINGIDVSDFTLTDTEFYRDSTSRTYLYTGVLLSYSKNAGGQTDKVTKSISFQADARQKV